MTESWAQLITFFIANTGLLLWFRAESRSDWRHMDNQVAAIREEIKDFHCKLIEIETKARNRKYHK